MHVAADILYIPLDALQSIIDAHYFDIDVVRHLQQLHRCNPNLFLGQLVQPLQAILDVCVSRQLLQIFF